MNVEPERRFGTSNYWLPKISNVRYAFVLQHQLHIAVVFIKNCNHLKSIFRILGRNPCRYNPAPLAELHHCKKWFQIPSSFCICRVSPKLLSRETLLLQLNMPAEYDEVCPFQRLHQTWAMASFKNMVRLLSPFFILSSTLFRSTKDETFFSSCIVLFLLDLFLCPSKLFWSVTLIGHLRN